MSRDIPLTGVEAAPEPASVPEKRAYRSSLRQEQARATRRAIVASPRRAELEAKLGTFPFDQKEARARAARYFDKSTTAVKRLEMKRQWQEEFREEYRRLREEAER